MSTVLFDKTALDRVLAEYPLSGARVVDLFEASNRNENFLVVDATGARYVLRRFRRNPDSRRVDFQVTFQQHLLRQGCPTSTVIETRTGHGFVNVSGKPWALFTYVDGAEYDFGCMEQAAEAGQRLGQFHILAETFPGEEVVLAFDPPIREWWTSWEENLRNLQEMFGGAGVDAELAYVRDWWHSFAREGPFARLDSLPVGWVHGDYHGRNMVFARDRMLGLFDFDAVNRGPLVYDVAYGMYMFGREDRGSTAIRAAAAQVFLDAYAQWRPLAAEEWAAIPTMLFLWWSPHARFYVHLQQDGVDLLARLRRDVSRMMALEEETQKLAPLWSR